MPPIAKKLLLFCATILLSQPAAAQDYASWRLLFSQVNVAVSGGGGGSWYTYDIVGPEAEKVVKTNGSITHYILTKDKQYKISWPSNRYPSSTLESYAEEPAAAISIGSERFQGRGYMFPVTVSLYTDLWQKVRLGGGGTGTVHYVEHLTPIENFSSGMNNYIFNPRTYSTIRPFGLFGVKLLGANTWSVVLEARGGVDLIYIPSEGFSIDDLALVNLGLLGERYHSEYFKTFARFSVELSRDQTTPHITRVVSKNRQGVAVQLGVSLRYPEVPRCSLPGCGIEQKHRHGGKVYRGISMFSRRGAQR